MALTAALATTTIGACSGVAPIRLAEQPVGHLSLPLQGVYSATVTAPFIGPVSARLAAEPSSTGFVANSRPGVAWDMIGGLQGFLGQIFAPFLFPGGVILTWNSGVPADGKPGEGWLGIGGIKSAGVKTRMTSPDGPIELLAPDGHKVAFLTLHPSSADAPPLADYPQLAANAAEGISQRLFDPGLVSSGQVRGYLSQLARNSRLAQDDVEFIFGAAVAAKNNVKFPLPLVIRRADEATRRAFPHPDPQLATVRATFDEPTGVATLRADAFLNAADVDRAFRQILSWHPRGLVIELHNCPGVTLASLRVASWLFEHPVDAGFFFGPTHRAEGLSGGVDGFPRVTIGSAEDVARAESALDTADAAAIVLLPERQVYHGPVAVLISKKTTTSAEPLAWLLKSTGRARLFGTTTAGKPTLSRPVDLGQGWDLWLASADFRPPIGDRINDKGVRPDEDISSKENAKRAARRWLAAQAGSAAAPAQPGHEAPAE